MSLFNPAILCPILIGRTAAIDAYSSRFITWLVALADRVYDFPSDTPHSERALRLFSARPNSFSHSIDICNGAAVNRCVDRYPCVLWRTSSVNIQW
jgi:hypothetical protein